MNLRSTQKTETSSAGKQNPSTTEKKPLKVKVETVLIIIAMTGHHDREQDTPSSDVKGYPYQVRAASRPDRRSGHRYKKCLNLAALEMNSDHNRNFKVEAL
mgnify:CR=1 FL=1